ncbi:hypothetical protein H0H92_001174 [Tricholoma furcatifolium]|nr:hypothetical protein H0H92_001174 [Tricholoma furcatifolium]
MVLTPAEVAHGPMLIGTILNVLLYGITIAQLYLYHTQSSKRDALWIQCLAYFIFIADTIQMVFTVVYMYDSLITHFGEVAHLRRANWVFATDPALTAIIGGFVQGFFAWRVKTLTRNTFLALIVMFFTMVSLFMGLGTAVAVGRVPIFIQFRKFKVVVILWLVSAAVADVVITFSLVSFLTDTRIDRISRSHGNLYSNSLMSSLNARSFWQNQDGEDALVNSNKTTFQLSKLKHGSEVTSRVHRDAEIFVEVESHRVTDPPEKINLTTV